MKKELSIIIPVYNLEKYIEKCLNSIISQITTNDIEIIIINDGSKDNSDAICKKYCEKYKYIKYFYQNNAGVSAARNKGVEIATGEYVMFVDGDDWILDGSLKEIYKKILLNKFDIIYGNGYNKIFSENAIINTEHSRICSDIETMQYPENFSKIFKNDVVNHCFCANIYRLSIIKDNNIFFDIKVKYTEDLDFYLNILINSTSISEIDRFYCYRQDRNDSATHNISDKRVMDTLNFVVKWFNKLEHLNLKNAMKTIILDFIKYEYILTIAYVFSLNKKKYLAIYEDVKKYSFLISKSNIKKINMTYYVKKIFGYNILGFLLNKYFLIIQSKR